MKRSLDAQIRKEEKLIEAKQKKKKKASELIAKKKKLEGLRKKRQSIK